jgi:hypothetical protein
MQRSIKIALLGIIILLTSCACITGNEDLPVIYNADNDLLNKRITHLVEWSANNNTETFLAVLEIQADKTQLIALMPTGMTLFSLSYTQAYQDLNTSILYSAMIAPEDLLSILQLVNYSTSNIQQQLPRSWYWQEQPKALQYQKNTVLQISNNHNDASQAITIKNLYKNYTLTVTRLSIEDTQ